MDRQLVEDILAEENPDALFLDGFDKAIIGIARRPNLVVVAYDAKKIIAELMGQGMDYDEASDYFGYNIECAWMGEHTPVIVGLNE